MLALLNSPHFKGRVQAHFTVTMHTNNKTDPNTANKQENKTAATSYLILNSCDVQLQLRSPLLSLLCFMYIPSHVHSLQVGQLFHLHFFTLKTTSPLQIPHNVLFVQLSWLGTNKKTNNKQDSTRSERPGAMYLAPSTITQSVIG